LDSDQTEPVERRISDCLGDPDLADLVASRWGESFASTNLRSRGQTSVSDKLQPAQRPWVYLHGTYSSQQGSSQIQTTRLLRATWLCSRSCQRDYSRVRNLLL
jgi:hypothetical protein